MKKYDRLPNPPPDFLDAAKSNGNLNYIKKPTIKDLINILSDPYTYTKDSTPLMYPKEQPIIETTGSDG